MTPSAIRRCLRAQASARDAKILRWFFKTGPGEYGEGDVFIGIRVPALRKLVREFHPVSDATVRALLRSRIHEERLLALLLLVRRFETGDDAGRRGVFNLYMANTDRVNNWDLVDLSAPNIVGQWLMERDRRRLDRLAGSTSLWERRIAIVSTFAFIRRNEFDDTFRIADRLLRDPHDLIHKATGWMLREVGKRDEAVLEAFLWPRLSAMPRTMLRYAIERFPEPKRRRFLTHRCGMSARGNGPLLRPQFLG
jgi:3-methyladenine DNA glycosylase AlkD